MKMNKKGFTLVELLAVIVILAVVMLIATTAVGPLMTKSRKSALGTEGISLVDAAKMAYQAEQSNSGTVLKATSDVCFDLEWLYNENYYTKNKTNDGYTGSVLVNHENGKYTYTFWISNGTYTFTKSALEYDVDNNTVVTEATESGASTTCGTEARTINCYGTADCVAAS